MSPPPGASQPTTAFQPLNSRPTKLQLQVPESSGRPVRLATPPVVLVNGENNNLTSPSYEHNERPGADLFNDAASGDAGGPRFPALGFCQHSRSRVGGASLGERGRRAMSGPKHEPEKRREPGDEAALWADIEKVWAALTDPTAPRLPVPDNPFHGSPKLGLLRRRGTRATRTGRAGRL